MAEPKPTITISPAAAKAFQEARESEEDALHLEVPASFQYGLFFGPRAPGDIEVEASGVRVLLDAASASRADGITIDFVDGPGQGFKIQSANEPARVKQIGPTALKKMLEERKSLALFDVRTERERAIAIIAGARFFDREAQTALEALDRSTTLVFHCHHGGRSQAAAERAVGMGFRDVYNLSGGIDAWSQAIDPSVPRY